MTVVPRENRGQGRRLLPSPGVPDVLRVEGVHLVPPRRRRDRHSRESAVGTPQRKYSSSAIESNPPRQTTVGNDCSESSSSSPPVSGANQ
ncbi:hypothetical protein [Haladaptatus cibarius]|uniref:hypothetical protein n=1 Tax=Haladaptatus cibarius TaxID=453847 RepID=UPI0011869A25|nr:hypothetical protein [Haladaptatus cibarius]